MRLQEALVLCTVLSWVAVARCCEYPEFMQSAPGQRDWWGRVRQQYMEFGLQIVVDGSTMRATSMDSSVRTYSRQCERSVRAGLYLARHEEGDGQTGYVCFGFVQRGPNVIQLRSSNVSQAMDVALCDQVTLDPWLVLDKAHIADHTQLCGLQGGFSIRIYDRMSGEGVCSAYQGETRMESECFAGEGLQFYFRYPTCIPQRLYMFSPQRTLCIASWTEGRNSYLLLRHDFYPYMWLLKYPALAQLDSFSAYLLLDLVADSSRMVALTRDYIQLDTVRDPPSPVTALCVDDYEICSYWNLKCNASQTKALTCPRHCKVCNATRPALCSFPAGWQGRWSYGDELSRPAVTVTDSTLTVAGQQEERFHCVNWDRDEPRDRNTRTQMLVADFSSGCRPRYSCVQVVQNRAGSVLFLKLSQAHHWPFVSDSNQPINCSAFSFDNDEKFMDNELRSKYVHLLHDDQTGAGAGEQVVNCSVPWTRRSFRLQTLNGTQCAASVTKSPSMTSLVVGYRGCGNSSSLPPSSHDCLHTSRLTNRELLIVTRDTQHSSDQLYCWLFPRQQRNVFYVLSGRDCHEDVANHVASSTTLPLLTFSKTRKKTTTIAPTTESASPAVPINDMDRRTGPTDEHGPNKTVADDDEDETDDSHHRPYVVVAAVLLFAVFQIPCICKAAS